MQIFEIIMAVMNNSVSDFQFLVSVKAMFEELTCSLN